MITFPNCKINFGLNIIAKRPDGYHNLETIFYPLPGLKDALEAVPASGDLPSLTVTGLAVTGEQENNLVWKAWQLMESKYPSQVIPLDFYLYKSIPMGAGLGGGSADGAFALRLINDYCNLGLSDDQLTEYALELGSDCPFFIYNTPQFASGRGEILQPVEIDLSAYSIQVICPGVHVSTADAFRMITPKPAVIDLRDIIKMPLIEWKRLMINDFEGPVFEVHPQLKEIKEQLYNDGALYASMSGSGSALFGLFEKGKRSDLLGAYFE